MSDYQKLTEIKEDLDTLVTTHTTTGVPVDIIKVLSAAAPVNSGNRTSGTLRVCVATDDINLAAIKTSTDDTDTATTALQASNAGTGLVMNLKNLNSVPISLDGGNADGGTIRVINCEDDFNLLNISGNTAGIITAINTSNGYLSTIDPNINSIEVAESGLVGFGINIKSVNTQPVDIGIGNAGLGTQRISIATNDANMSAINSKVGLTNVALSDINALLTGMATSLGNIDTSLNNIETILTDIWSDGSNYIRVHETA